MIRFEMKISGPIANPGPHMDKVLRLGLHQAGAAVLGNVKERTPVDTGTLKASERLNVTGSGPTIQAIIGTGVSYAASVETGSRPNRRMPPSSALLPWARRHPSPVTRGGKRITDQQRAFLIARAIGKRGTKGAHMFERGMEAAKPAVSRIFNTMGRILAQELGGS